MSGYLQRLVNAAAGDGDAVHPRTGSIFSPRAEGTAALVPGGQEYESTALHPPHARPPDASLPGESAVPADRAARGPSPTPLFPPASRVPAAGTMVAAPLVRAAASDIDGGVHPDDRSWQARGGGDPPTDVRVATPRVREEDEASRLFAAPDRGPEPRVPSAEATRLRSERHAAQSERQPDDIQIHIGRIEVIAVPPPATPAPKAPDRSLSLEAYLNRRDGRRR
jgi:hypothetical protein